MAHFLYLFCKYFICIWLYILWWNLWWEHWNKPCLVNWEKTGEFRESLPNCYRSESEWSDVRFLCYYFFCICNLSSKKSISVHLFTYVKHYKLTYSVHNVLFYIPMYLAWFFFFLINQIMNMWIKWHSVSVTNRL